MDSLQFLYISLGVGFLLLVTFLCVMLIYFIRILKDITEITDNIKDTAHRVNEYVVQPFTLVKEFYENIKPIIDAVQQKKEDIKDTVDRTLHRGKKK